MIFKNIAKIRRTKHLTERVASMKASYYTLLENQEYAAQLSLEASRKAIANLAKKYGRGYYENLR